MALHDSLSVVNYPAICYAQPAGLTRPANEHPDTAVSEMVIPLDLKSYDLPNRKANINQEALLPIFAGTPQGGKYVSHSNIELGKCTIEGHIDTPFTGTEGSLTSTITYEGKQLTWGQVISHLTDGTMGWHRPLWFRDPFGRVYNSPRVLDFTASYIENVPFRNNFSMQMKV